MFGEPDKVISETKYKVSDVADVQVGLVIKPTRFYSDVQTPYPAFRSLNVGPLEVRDSDWVYFTEKGMEENQRTIAHTGDVLVVRSGYPGTSCVVPPEYDGRNVVDLIIAHPDTNKILPEFLCAYTNFPHGKMQIEANQRGVAQKHFNVSLYNAMKIVVPDLDKQQEFVQILKQSDKSKFTGFKSQFIEMFGEPGKDDKGWGVTTLDECCVLNPKRPRDIDDELMVSFVPMPAVSEDGKIDCSDIRPYKEVRKGFTYFAEDDVLFAKITPCMENGKGAVAKGLAGGIGSGSTEFHVLRPIDGKSNPYWLYILTMFESFRVGARKVMTGTGGQLRVPIGYLKYYPISLPPIELQEQFERFVHQSDKSK